MDRSPVRPWPPWRYGRAVQLEPRPTPWVFPTRDELVSLPDDEETDLIAVGADLAAGTILAAYRGGLFPMPHGQRRVGWWCPARRGVLPLGALHVARSLRRSVRDFEIRVDTAFAEVVDGCADPKRPGGWIDDRIKEAYLELHRFGWAHSVEAWRDGRLAGGLYGVVLGGLFAGESMFHRERDASKVALVGLVDLLRDEHADRRLIDTQWVTPHLAGLGVVEIGRREYLERLPDLLAVPVAVPFLTPPALAGPTPRGPLA